MAKLLKEQTMDEITAETLRKFDYNEIVNEKRMVRLLREVMTEIGLRYFTIQEVEQSYRRVMHELWSAFGKGKHGIR